MLVKDTIYDDYVVELTDSSIEGIMWVKFTSRINSNDVFYVCVCYLPPEGSTRNVNAHEFYDNLLSQILTIPNQHLFFVCGDFNSRCGNEDDFIRGIDCIPDRHVIDFNTNNYGNIFCEFLINANLCILNGRNHANNDFTYVSTRGLSVVDFCLVPYECLDMFTEFNVIRASNLAENAGCVGVVDPRVYPDHSLLKWYVKLNTFTHDANSDLHTPTSSNSSSSYQQTSNVKYDTSTVPPDFLMGVPVVQCLQEAIRVLESSHLEQSNIDCTYNAIVDIIKDEMNTNLKSKTISFDSCVNNKKRRIGKPWWNSELTHAWNHVCICENDFIKARRLGLYSAQELKSRFVTERKHFDRLVQKAKRAHWHNTQLDMLSNQSKNQKQFWKDFGKIGIGNERQNCIPMEVIDQNGTISNNTDTVLDKWRTSFSDLYNPTFTPDVDANVRIPYNMLDFIESHPCNFNDPLSLSEVRSAIMKAKSGKASGLDCIPIDVLKNESMVICLCKLFNHCYDKGVVPSCWSKAIVNPIPKSSTSDNRNPMQYRGITLAASMYKVYCSVLNERLTSWAETNNIVHDEQNGFRKGRSTIDHINSLTTLLETRKSRKLSTYCAFIDFKKAYDSVDRDILWAKISALGISGNMALALKSLYNNVQCCVRVNGLNTDFFNVTTGLKQGCLLSSLMFNLFINDFIAYVKSLGIGINVGDSKVCILIYADDIVLMAETEEQLQTLLDALHAWCSACRMSVNLEKSNILHFRPPSVEVSRHTFLFGKDNLTTASEYRYLGLVITDHLDFNVTAKIVAKSASRALGLLIAKSKAFGGFRYSTFTKLYDTLVYPVINYGSAIWGTREYSCINAIQNRAARFFMGLGRYAPNIAVNGDMGWKPPIVKQWERVFRHWNRCVTMDTNRVNSKIFHWSLTCARNRCKNWHNRVFVQSLKLRIHDFTVDNDPNYVFDTCTVDNSLATAFIDDWHKQLWSNGTGTGNNKLRTYRLFKNTYNLEKYLWEHLPHSHRSAFAKFRCGTAPIRIETGRYENIPLENRTCFHCSSANLNIIESEIHVLTECPLYCDIRTELFVHAHAEIPNFSMMSNCDKFINLFQNENLIKYCAKTCHFILTRRRNVLYS